MANLEKIIAFQTQETVEEMQKKLEKSFRLEIKQTTKNIQKEINAKFLEIKDTKTSKTLSSEESQEYTEENLPHTLGKSQTNPNQNLSINIRVDNQKRRTSSYDEQNKVIDTLKERVEFLHQSYQDLSEELRKKIFVLNQKLQEFDGTKTKDTLTPILQITDQNQV